MRDAGVILLLCSVVAIGAPNTQTTSPNSQLKIAFDSIASGQLVYAVTFKGRPLVEASPIRIDLQGASPLGPAVRIVDSSDGSNDDTYRPVAGKTSVVRNHFNALTMNLEETAGLHRKLRIEARAFDDAVAFRYVIPEQSAVREFRLTQEHTEFRIAKDATTYALELPNYRTMYESEFLKLPISAFANASGTPGTRLIGLPLLMEVPGVAWMAITEASMRGNAAMYLFNPGEPGRNRLESRISPSVTDPDVAVTGPLPHVSPWRVMLASEEPAKLIESTTVLSLNPASMIQDTSWIHPGKSAWDWWSGSLNADGQKAFTTENMKYYVDFAAKSGLEYMLVDAGWTSRNDITKMPRQRNLWVVDPSKGDGEFRSRNGCRPDLTLGRDT